MSGHQEREALKVPWWFCTFCEDLCNKGMGKARHVNPCRIHSENVTDTSVRCVCALEVEKCEILQKTKEVFGYLRLFFLVSCFCSNPVLSWLFSLCNVDQQPLAADSKVSIWGLTLGFEEKGCGGAFLLGGPQVEKFIQ